ncbi:uncharacterized protein [Nicotiana tomentosiformis]|uniref:uncharacterized protein n=1 Tax=Nicotiana tomentosiformis TaxID=4098 RepID=UPI00388CE630
MEGVDMMVNKKMTKGPQVQNRGENYVREDGGFEQDDSYNEQEEEVQYVNNFQGAEFAKALCDLGASINLMPNSVFKTLEIEQPRPTSMRLQMVNHTMKRPLGVIEDVLLRDDKFILLADFVIIDCEVDYEMSIILGRPFLAKEKVLCDVEARELTFQVGDEKVVFYVCKSIRQPNSNEVCSFLDLVTDVIVDEISATTNVGDILEAVLLNFDDERWMASWNV